MRELSYALLAEGSSDVVLRNIIDWTIRQIRDDIAINGQFADLSLLPNPPAKNLLHERIRATLIYYPSQLLIIHRDSDTRNGFGKRVIEVENQVNVAKYQGAYVILVPITMTEAWLLSDENAIKKAAGNRSYPRLQLPPTSQIEDIRNPKEHLHSLIYEASQKTGRARKKLNVNQRVHQVAEYTTDFSQLDNCNRINTSEVKFNPS